MVTSGSLTSRCFYNNLQCGYDDTSYACLEESQCCSDISDIEEVSKAVARFSSPLNSFFKEPQYTVTKGGFGLPLLVLGAFLLDACGDGPVVEFSPWPEKICWAHEDCPTVGPCLGACTHGGIATSEYSVHPYYAVHDRETGCGTFWCNAENPDCGIDNIDVACDTDLKCCVPQTYIDTKGCARKSPNPISPVDNEAALITPHIEIHWEDPFPFRAANPLFEVCWVDFDKQDESFFESKRCPDYAFSAQTTGHHYRLDGLKSKTQYLWKVRHQCDFSVDLGGADFSPVQSFLTATNIMAQFTFEDNPFLMDDFYEDQRCIKNTNGILLSAASLKTLCDTSGNLLQAIPGDASPFITWIESSVFEGKALFFSLSPYQMTIPDDPLLATDSIAIEIFLNLRVPPRDKLILAQRMDTNGDGYSLSIDNAGLVHWAINTSAAIYVSPALPINLVEESYILALAYEKSLQFIVNGNRIQNRMNETFGSQVNGGDVIMGLEEGDNPKAVWQLDEINFYYGLNELQLEQRLDLVR